MAIREAHQAGRPVPIAGEGDEVVWLHPDGIVRPTKTPVHTTNP